MVSIDNLFVKIGSLIVEFMYLFSRFHFLVIIFIFYCKHFVYFLHVKSDFCLKKGTYEIQRVSFI